MVELEISTPACLPFGVYCHHAFPPPQDLRFTVPHMDQFRRNDSCSLPAARLQPRHDWRVLPKVIHAQPGLMSVTFWPNLKRPFGAVNRTARNARRSGTISTAANRNLKTPRRHRLLQPRIVIPAPNT